MVNEQVRETVAIETAAGTREVNSDEIIYFPDGLPGFEEFREFAVFDIEVCEPFKSMLSIDPGGPDFIVVEPMTIFEDYNPLDSICLSDNVKLGTPLDIAVIAIVTVAEDFKNSTVNLRGPILLNLATSRARQVILTDDRYNTRTPLIVE